MNILLHARIKHRPDEHGMWLVAHFEHMLWTDVTKALCGGLQVIEGSSQVSLGRKHHCTDAFLCVWEVLFLTYLYDL